MTILRRCLFLAFVCLLTACVTKDPTAKLVSTRLIPTSTPAPRQTSTPTATAWPTATIAPTNTPIPPPTSTPITLVPVIIAIKPLPAGSVISPDSVLRVMWPESTMLVNVLSDRASLIEQVTLTDIACFEPLQSHFVAERTTGDGFPPLAGTCPPSGDSVPYTLAHVVVTTRTLNRGMTIAPHDIALQPWPAAFLPPQAITSLTDAIGKTIQVDRLAMQPLLQSNITPP